MAILKCVSPSQFSREYSKKYNIKEAVVLQKIDSWQLLYNRDNLPSVEELNAFIKEQKKEMNLTPETLSMLDNALTNNNIVKVSYNGEIYLVTSNGVVIRKKDNSILNISEGNELYDALQEQASEYFGSRDMELDDNTEAVPSQKWDRYAPSSQESYEVSSKGDRRFSAFYAVFKPNTIIDGTNVGGKSIEWVYQNIMKKSGKGKAPSRDSKLYNPNLKTDEEKEDFSYTEGYLPLWKEWARQNPELIEELRQKAKGKYLTDKFASTRVSQARALADIINDSNKKTLKTEDNVYQRLSQEELGSSDRNLQEAEALLTRGDVARNKGSETAQRGVDEEVSSREAEERIIESWAKEKGLWHENIDTELHDKYGDKIGHGSESWVYSKDNKTVIKSRSTTQFNSIQEAIESVILHNHLNPNTAYRLVGMGMSDNEFTLMLEQPYVEGREATQEEIDNYVKSLGFEKGKGKTNFSNDRYRYEDLKPANVLIDADGNFNVIDSDVYAINQGEETGDKDIIQVTRKKWTRETAEGDNTTLYVFTDNSNRDSGSNPIDENSWYAKKYGKGLHYPTATSAVIRGLNNARPITTQKLYKKGVKVVNSRWSDEDVDEFEKIIASEIDEIIKEWNTGKYAKIELPMRGLFNSSISMISKERVPKLYEILNNQLNRLLQAVGQKSLWIPEKISKKKSRKQKTDTWTYLSEEYQELYKEAKKQASQMTVRILDSRSSAAIAWRWLGKQYGFITDEADEAGKQHSTMKGQSLDDWFDLPFAQKKFLNSVYQEAVDYNDGIHRNASKIDYSWTRESVKNDYVRKKAIMARLAYLQVKNADSLFTVGHISEPGEKITTDNGIEYINNASFQTVDGPTGVYVRYATTLRNDNDELSPIPVHVYDTEKGHWYTWKDNGFVEEETPTLTPKALLTGIQTSEKSFYKGLGSDVVKAMKEVFTKTFGFEAISQYGSLDSRGLDVTELGEARQALNAEAAEYQTTTEDMNVNDNNPLSKLSLEIDPHTRVFRVEMMARDFSLMIDRHIDEDAGENGKAMNDYYQAEKAFLDYIEANPIRDNMSDEELRARQATIDAKSRGLDKLREYMDVMTGTDGAAQRRAVIQHYGLDAIFQEMKQLYSKASTDGQVPEYHRGEFKKVADNFDALIQEALEQLQYIENFRIIPVQIKNSKKVQGEISNTQAENLLDDEGFADDEAGTRSTGNDGWSFKMRFVDPRLSTSQVAKKALSQLYMRDNNGRVSRDDLGHKRYLNSEYAHAVLMNELCEMVDSDDFCLITDRDKDGNPSEWRFPALEKAQSKYPWVQDLIDYLQDNEQAVGAFFHDFNKAFIQYAKIDSDGKSMVLNAPVAQESALNSLIRNYQNGVILSDDSLYGTAEINKENAKKLLEAWKELQKTVNNPNFELEESAEDIVLVLTNTLKAIGFDINPEWIERNLVRLFEDEKRKNKDWKIIDKRVSTILSLIADSGKKGWKRTFHTDDNYVQFFRQELKAIASIVGQISELDNVQSFREGEEARYSYSAVNYIINMCKSIKSDAHRKNFIEQEFGNLFFKKDGKYRNEWINLLASDTPEGAYLRDNLQTTEVISLNTGSKELKNTKTVVYADWDKGQTYRIMFSQFFRHGMSESQTQLADYNMPIFSDAPTSMYITMKRYVDNNATQQTYKQQLMPHLVDIVMQELDRMGLIEGRKKSRAAVIQNFDKRGSKFCFFPELNDYVLPSGQKYVDALKPLIAKGKYQEIRELTAPVLEDVMNRLFSDFISDLGNVGFTSAVEQLRYLKVYDNKLQGDDAIEATYKALENYFWNSTFATSQIIQMTTTDLAFYKNPVDFQKRFKEVYAMGNRLNTNTKYGRKTENTIYIADLINTSSSYTGLKQSLENAVKAGRMSKGRMKWILKKAKEINVADAQAFRNPYSFRAILDMMGKWTDEMEEAFNRMLSGTFDEGDFNIIYQTIKPFLFTNDIIDSGVQDSDNPWFGQKIRVPHQNKNSEFLVLAFFDLVSAASSQSDFLKGLGKFFNAHSEIDVIQFESAVKSGGQGIVDLNYSREALTNTIESLYKKGTITEDDYNHIGLDKDNNPVFEDFKELMDKYLDSGKISQNEYNDIFEEVEPTADELSDMLEEAIAPVDSTGKKNKRLTDVNNGIFNHDVIHQHSYNDYMIAQPTPEHLMDQEDATSGSQFRYLILANLPETVDGKPFTVDITVGGKTLTLNKRQIMDLYRGAIVDNLLDAYGKVKGKFADIYELQKYIFKAIEGNPKYGSDIVEALQIVEIPNPKAPGETMKVFNLPLDLPTITNQVQELLCSIFKNKITKQTINGGNCIQVACCGLTKKLNLERDENGKIIAAQCLLPAWSRKFFMPFLTKGTKKVKDANGMEHNEPYTYIDIEKMKRVCPDLLKMVGYRIPTENKYSMLPLKVVGFLPQQNGSAIMLPADITLMAGSDFDVDKMYLRIPAIDKNYYRKTGKIRKLQYSLDDLSELTKEGRTWDATSQGRMTKEQRDNLMIDIEYAVLTSTVGSEQLYSPGNFDDVKRQARILRMLSNKELVARFILAFGDYGHQEGDQLVYTQEEIAEAERLSTNPNAILELLNRKGSDDSYIVSLDAIDKFLESYQPVMNSLVPQTYNYLHEQNMKGKSLVGVYANGASIHSKGQESQLRLAKGQELQINGRVLDSLHEQRRKETRDGKVVETDYIQDILAQFQAASVDNAKDPVLADLLQSMFTAGNTILMIRLGMNFEEIALLYNVIKYDVPPSDFMNGISTYLRKELGNTKDRERTEIPTTSSEQLLKAQIYIRDYPKLFNAIKYFNAMDKDSVNNLWDNFKESGLSQEDLLDMVDTISQVSEFYEHINSLRAQLKPANDIMKADSPNNAIATTLPAAILQRRAVTVASKRLSKAKSPFRGVSDAATQTINEFIHNECVLYGDNRQAMKRKIMAQRHPYVQAFYSLGIELPIEVMQDYFIQGNDELIALADEIMDQSETGMMTERQINTFFREFMMMVLTSTKTFGENFDKQREYYLYYLPKRENLIKTVKEIEELRHNPTVSRLLSVGEIYPTIKLPRSGKLTPQMKAAIRRDFNALLYSKDLRVVKFAKDLFLYSFYHDGFNYGAESFGTYFDATFWNAFPEVVSELRTFKYDGSYSALIPKFKELWLANHAQDDIIKAYHSQKQRPVYNEDGSVSLRKGDCYTDYSNGVVTYIRVLREKDSKEYRVYKLASQVIFDKDTQDYDSLLTYRPLAEFDEPSPVYNANGNVKDMEKLYWNNRMILVEQKQKKIAEEKERKKQAKAKKKDIVPAVSDNESVDDSPSADALAANNGELDEQNYDIVNSASIDEETNQQTVNAAQAALEESTEDEWFTDHPYPKEAVEQLEHPDDAQQEEEMKRLHLEKISQSADNQRADNEKIDDLEKGIDDVLSKENPCNM